MRTIGDVCLLVCVDVCRKKRILVDEKYRVVDEGETIR